MSSLNSYSRDTLRHIFEYYCFINKSSGDKSTMGIITKNIIN